MLALSLIGNAKMKKTNKQTSEGNQSVLVYQGALLQQQNKDQTHNKISEQGASNQRIGILLYSCTSSS